MTFATSVHDLRTLICSCHRIIVIETVADGGLSRRLFGAFLTWLQGKKQEDLIVAAANHLASLPPELLMQGRVHEILFVDWPDQGKREHLRTWLRNDLSMLGPPIRLLFIVTVVALVTLVG